MINMNTPTIDKYIKKFNDFKAQQPGTALKVVLTDADATAALREYIEKNNTQVQVLIKDNIGVNIDIIDPVITFTKDMIDLTAKGKISLIKITISATAKVTWDGMLHVEAQSLNVPVISISPEKINPAIKEPLNKIMKKIQEYIEIHSFRITEGAAFLEGTKKLVPQMPVSAQSSTSVNTPLPNSIY